MARMTRSEIQNALRRLGKLASEEQTHIDLIVVGGAATVLAYNARESTQDVGSFILMPKVLSVARKMVIQVASELGLPDDWLNDGAKGYLRGYSDGGIVFESEGITIRCPSTAQLLAMKLAAWRDDVDIADANRLLGTLRQHPLSKDDIWAQVLPHLIPGSELKAQYAFQDLWETMNNED